MRSSSDAYLEVTMDDVLLVKIVHTEACLEEVNESFLLWEPLTFLDVME